MQPQESFTRKISFCYDVTYEQGSMASDGYVSTQSRFLCFSYAWEQRQRAKGFNIPEQKYEGTVKFSFTSSGCFRLRLEVYVSGVLTSAKRVYTYFMNYCCNTEEKCLHVIFCFLVCLLPSKSWQYAVFSFCLRRCNSVGNLPQRRKFLSVATDT